MQVNKYVEVFNSFLKTFLGTAHMISLVFLF